MASVKVRGDELRESEAPYTPPAGADRLNAIASRDGWRRALVEVFGPDPAASQYATDPSRARFVELLPLTPESTVLELGSNLGQITCALAKRAGHVEGLEVAADQAQFAATRCLQEGHSHVSVRAGGGDCRLPYGDESFDGVVINLVLEWCAGADPVADHAEMQRRLLAESARVLKPRGWLYLCTKNRFGLNYLTGKGDEHTFQWRFGQAMPRSMLALLMRLCGKSRTPGWIHSYGAMRRLLAEAGFNDLEPFWAVPEFRFPTEIIRADGKSIREARRRRGFVQGPHRSSRLLMPLVPAALVKYVMPGLIFLARKAG